MACSQSCQYREATRSRAGAQVLETQKSGSLLTSMVCALECHSMSLLNVLFLAPSSPPPPPPRASLLSSSQRALHMRRGAYCHHSGLEAASVRLLARRRAPLSGESHAALVIFQLHGMARRTIDCRQACSKNHVVDALQELARRAADAISRTTCIARQVQIRSRQDLALTGPD